MSRNRPVLIRRNVMTEVSTRRGETPHDVYDAELKGHAELHRYDNAAGYPMSSVYALGREILSCDREDEWKMLESWNEYGCHDAVIASGWAGTGLELPPRIADELDRYCKKTHRRKTAVMTDAIDEYLSRKNGKDS